MNNNYYNPYARPFCELPQRQNDFAAPTETDELQTGLRSCEKQMKNPIPESTAYAMAYVPFQSDAEAYDSETALRRGTLFPSLDKPFKGGCRCE